MCEDMGHCHRREGDGLGWGYCEMSKENLKKVFEAVEEFRLCDIVRLIGSYSNLKFHKLTIIFETTHSKFCHLIPSSFTQTNAESMH